ncbi:sugar ABC transporter permease [Paenibacillus sp. yr247]|uniref:ABC transporter permease n=1 Tax=Paenibacillus sp. yr247 TaxID=1761880 RepID=UPI000B841817|nr:sugar ABC transporter permease [Paenibacillus sp. yr247]
MMQMTERRSRFPKWLTDWELYMLLLPGLAFFLIFKYAPMFGIVMAFQDYSPFQGITGSKWVGFKHFADMFAYDGFWRLLRNTLLISCYNIVFYFPAPIIVALMLNEIRREWFKKSVQTIIYLPHFISWVVVGSITYFLLNPEEGLINQLLTHSGMHSMPFLTDSNWFRTIIVSQSIWKEVGWGTIIFLAALAGVDPQLYEAAVVDGAGRWRQLWHVTLPALRSTIIVLLILRLGHVLDVGFEQIFLMLNELVYQVGDVFDTYVFREGITGGRFSFGVAVGLFKSVVGLILVISANWLAKKAGEEGIY